MSVSPPSSSIRARLASRNLRNWSVAWTRKSARSMAASPASSPSMLLRLVSMSPLWSAGVLGGGPEPFPEEHQMMALEQPLARPMAERTRGFVGFQLVERPVVGQLEQDDVVEVPAVGDVVPAEEL